MERDSDIPSSFKVKATNVLTLWVDAQGQLRRFDLALRSSTDLPNLGFKRMEDSITVEIGEIDNAALPSSFLSKAPPSKPANGNAKTGISKAHIVIQRMKKHYAGLKTAVLDVRLSRFSLGGADVLSQKQPVTYQAYFRYPNLFGSNMEKTRRLASVRRSELDRYGALLLDPGGFLIIIPFLFQRFQIADIFPRLSYGGQGSVGGEKTDMITLERDISMAQGNVRMGISALTLWINGRGQLRRYDLAYREATPSPDHRTVSLGSVTVSETDDGPLPKSFAMKTQSK